MKTTDVHNQEKMQLEHDYQSSKIGTWISLGVVATVILSTYFVLFGLYMARL